MKVCSNRHITGYTRCWCGAKAMPAVGTRPGFYDTRAKRRITAMIRAAGGIPVADLRRGVRT